MKTITEDFVICGSFTFIHEDEQESKGYMQVLDNKPHLLYQSQSNPWTNLKYWFNEDEQRIATLFDYLVYQYYTMEETKEKYPEVLL